VSQGQDVAVEVVEGGAVGVGDGIDSGCGVVPAGDRVFGVLRVGGVEDRGAGVRDCLVDGADVAIARPVSARAWRSSVVAASNNEVSASRAAASMR
jgi:hypothetical protein